MLVALAVLFSNLDSLFAAADSNSTSQTKSMTPAKAEKAKVTLKPGSKPDANAPAAPKKIDPNSDPNALKAKWQKSLDEAMEKLEKNKESDSREWTQRSAESRVNRIKSLDKQVTEELDLIRKTAVEEKAARTVETIDRVLANRKERLDKLIDSIEEARKKEIRKEKEDRDKERKEKRPRDSEHKTGY
jgi:hypothetical protein